MSRSSKILVASCICAAFLAVGISCTVEERDIEEKGVFLCESDNDCLEGSKCVGQTDSKPIGRCVREEDIDHCVDVDGDHFYTSTDPKYDNECGFTETNPKDPDDNNPMIHFGAAETCDGFDNSGDGCVDGICPKGADCKSDPSKCEEIIKPCYGGGKVESYDKSVCSKDRIGVEKCVNGSLVFKIYKNGSYIDPTGDDPKACPKSTEEIPGYQTTEDCANDIDDNCNTMVNEGCTKCSDDLAKSNFVACYVVNGANGKGVTAADTEKSGSEYNTILNDGCGGDKNNCKCLGVFKCLGPDSEPMSCANASGNKIQANDIENEACYKIFDPDDN